MLFCTIVPCQEGGRLRQPPCYFLNSLSCYLRILQVIRSLLGSFITVNPILPGGWREYAPLLFFLHHPKKAQGMTLKHFLQVKPVRYILSCCHGNKITKGTLQNLAPKKSEKSAICKDIELKFGIEIKFRPLSSKIKINLQFNVIVTSL